MCGFCAAVAVYGIGKYRLEQQLRNIQALSSGRLGAQEKALALGPRGPPESGS